MPAADTTSITSRFLVELLDGHGQPPDDLLETAGIDRARLASSECRVPLVAFRELWARAARLQPDVGLRLVDRFRDGQMHLLAHLALRSPSVAAAMQMVIRFAGITTPSDRFELQREGELAWFVYAGARDNPWIVEHYFAMLVRFIQRSAGRALPLARVEFAAPRQAPESAYPECFGVTPVFDAPRNALGLDAAALDWPLLTHDAYLGALLEQLASARQPRQQDDPLDPFRRRLATALLRGETPALERLATESGTTPARLRKQLTAAGTTFRDLLDATRRDLAQQHLRSDLSVTQIAYLLGFSEPAAFQHACRRWFGCSAGDMQRRLAAGARHDA